ncbi:MAG TPA: hypothetical protein VN721_12605 [Flavipsychrobacter sp.]|nr:hypothetical protein [Flavipsychrobacter sp.]
MKTCFVISPIGQEGTDTRKNADDLYDLIIEPALEKYEFNVVRGDKVMTTSAITEDIVNYVQNSELCIIDLTGQNPNVFYETGRRHETAKPFIHIRRKGEQLPFDIAGIRTIDYDLSDGRKIKESIDNLRQFINELEITGYGSQSSSFSLNSIATTLSRIERKIDAIDTNAPAIATNGAEKLTGNPARIFYDAITLGNYTQATVALKKFMVINNDPNLHLNMALALVEAYEPSGVPIVREILEKDFDSLNTSTIAIALDDLYRFHTAAMNIKDQYDYIKGFIQKTLERNATDKEKAALYNTFASLEDAIKNEMKALEYQKKSVELDPAEPAYQYNMAILCGILGLKDDVLKSLDYLVAIYNSRDPRKEKINIDYLNYAKGIYKKNGVNDKTNQIDDIINNAKKYSEVQN